jgi:nucleotide-binding universal stress UspA family protein
MYSKIIIGYDGSAPADDALALGKLLAGATGASLTAVTVLQYDPIWGGRDIHLQDADGEAKQKLDKAAAAAGAEAQIVTASSPARGLHDLAEQLQADLIVIGSSSHGKAGQILAGSSAISLLHGSPCSVAIAPHGYAEQAPDSLAEVTVGYDGGDESKLALTDAINLARAAGAPVKLVAVVEPAPIVYGKGSGIGKGRHELDQVVHDMMRGRLDEALWTAPEGVNVDGTLVDGDPATALEQIGVEDGGVLVLGSRGYGPLRRVLLGSVSSKLLRSAPCPVIVHPRRVEAQEQSTSFKQVSTTA